MPPARPRDFGRLQRTAGNVAGTPEPQRVHVRYDPGMSRSRFSVVAAAFLSGAVACGGGADSSSSSTSSSSSSGGSTSSSASSGGSTSSSGATTSSSGGSTSSTSGSTTSAANVTGLWAGKVGNDGSYLDLTQSGATVTGTACEAPGKQCYPLSGGNVAGDTFSGAYSWDENGKTQTVTMNMKVAADNRSMQGTYVSTKCGGCTLQAALGKQN